MMIPTTEAEKDIRIRKEEVPHIIREVKKQLECT